MLRPLLRNFSRFAVHWVIAAVTKLSPSNRWGQLTYPNIRFGYKQPGNLFIARRAWWRIPVVYQTTQQTVEDQVGVNRYPSAPANYVLSVYEIPSQLPISGNANIQIGADSSGTAWGNAISVTGSVYGNQIQLSGGTYSGVSSRQQVNVVNPATVGGVAYADSADSAFDQPGTREQMALTQTIMGAAPVTVAGNDGKVLLVPVMPGNNFYMAAAECSDALGPLCTTVLQVPDPRYYQRALIRQQSTTSHNWRDQLDAASWSYYSDSLLPARCFEFPGSDFRLPR